MHGRDISLPICYSAGNQLSLFRLLTFLATREFKLRAFCSSAPGGDKQRHHHVSVYSCRVVCRVLLNGTHNLKYRSCCNYNHVEIKIDTWTENKKVSIEMFSAVWNLNQSLSRVYLHALQNKSGTCRSCSQAMSTLDSCLECKSFRYFVRIIYLLRVVTSRRQRVRMFQQSH